MKYLCIILIILCGCVSNQLPPLPQESKVLSVRKSLVSSVVPVVNEDVPASVTDPVQFVWEEVNLKSKRMFRFKFYAEPNKIYEVQYCRSMESPQWFVYTRLYITSPDNIVADFPVVDSEPQRFFRVCSGN